MGPSNREAREYVEALRAKYYRPEESERIYRAMCRQIVLRVLAQDVVPPQMASRGRRLVGGLIDLVLLGAVAKTIMAVLLAGVPAVGPPALEVEVDTFVLTSVLAAAYMAGCWVLSGMTIGMRLMHIRVVDAQTGGPISGRQAWRRFLVWYLAGGLAFVVMLLGRDPEQRTWYDHTGGTVVLED